MKVVGETEPADPDPEPLKERLVNTADMDQVVILRLSVRWMGGKQGG